LGDDPNSHQHCPGTRFYFSDITVSNVALRLQNLKASKATGMDSIPAKVLKASSHIIAISLTVILRQSLSTGGSIDILYTLEGASNSSAIQKLKP
jgi:hypothetical protein